MKAKEKSERETGRKIFANTWQEAIACRSSAPRWHFH